MMTPILSTAERLMIGIMFVVLVMVASCNADPTDIDVHPPDRPVAVDTVTITRTDTLVITVTDTLFVPVTDTLYITVTDTLYVPVFDTLRIYCWEKDWHRDPPHFACDDGYIGPKP